MFFFSFSQDIFIRVAIFASGVCGYMVARHIHNHKQPNAAPLVCPVKFNCHAVVHSDYSRFAGIPVEIFGMFYYGLVSFSYLFFVFVPEAMPVSLINLTIALSSIAFLFSLYLIFVQIFVLRKGCSWCIVSAIISALIFALTVATYHLSYIIEILPGVFLK